MSRPMQAVGGIPPAGGQSDGVMLPGGPGLPMPGGRPAGGAPPMGLP